MVPDTTGRTETDPTSLIMLRSQVRFLLAPPTWSPWQTALGAGASNVPIPYPTVSVAEEAPRPWRSATVITVRHSGDRGHLRCHAGIT
jgi:hypothetical protein